ncbi:hypothetical protein [Fusobacterium nucleatum]|uniref:hypothetical protein n=1 Tax=Fusobacterium nucleatum TaxID=851 RepID=UPI001EF05AA7|nr:hypothetical protein [Fusobacterium nucleatum]MCG6845267.1 hypothetical protein [Fusobacterium nucleatum]
MGTTNLILKIISVFIAALCIILIRIDREKHILNTKMKNTIAILSILAFISSFYILFEIIISLRK